MADATGVDALVVGMAIVEDIEFWKGAFSGVMLALAIFLLVWIVFKWED